MTATAAELDALYRAAEDECVDGLMKARFGVEPQPDFSGLFTGQIATLATSPAPPSEPAAPTLPTIHQGARAPAPDDDGAMVDAYVARYFPQAARNT